MLLLSTTWIPLLVEFIYEFHPDVIVIPIPTYLSEESKQSESFGALRKKINVTQIIF
jgi:hypothetical protein